MKKIILIATLIFLAFLANAQIKSFYTLGNNVKVKTSDSSYTIPITDLNTSSEYDNFYDILQDYTDGEDVVGYVYQDESMSEVFDRLVITGSLNNYIANIYQVSSSFPVKLSTGDKTKFDILVAKIGTIID